MKKLYPLILIIVIWELSYIIFTISNKIIPPPSELLLVFINLIKNGELLEHSIASLKRVLIGFGISTVFSVVLGLSTAYYKPLRNFLNPIIEVLRPIPPIAWIPIAIVFLGLGDSSAFFIVFLGSFFPIYSNTYHGAISLPSKFKNISRTLEISKYSYIKNVLFRHSLPNIFAGLKIGLGMAWMSVIAAEMIGAQSGLGYFIQINRLILGTDKIIIGMIIIGLIGLILTKLIGVIEKYSIPWMKYD